MSKIIIKGQSSCIETLKRNFDIDIKYYAMVDFETFATGVDTLFPNGVEINASLRPSMVKKVSSVQVPDDLKMDKNGHVPNQTIKVGKQDMDGRTLLNYARFRRMTRRLWPIPAPATSDAGCHEAA